jgi:hypothetical protein
MAQTHISELPTGSGGGEKRHHVAPRVPAPGPAGQEDGNATPTFDEMQPNAFLIVAISWRNCIQNFAESKGGSVSAAEV